MRNSPESGVDAFFVNLLVALLLNDMQGTALRWLNTASCPGFPHSSCVLILVVTNLVRSGAALVAAMNCTVNFVI